ncbi:UDP-N-acetyl-D-glucosamine dehydrogenase [Lysinibacillus alkalisoli]|uniref:UDP-N-acetyl-D-glucosamine dehydrogenase n=1 Tax=Lysinibacillus alkalisoli TaxID=1911548 RepID=A0A917G5H2_9BACI|nr:nucleotide sugar dehydrogenase [Lysinibacillus alkalisoli]GGG24236.1 UDP-N-acetyl-D-glucosamine dehydrogenase [Lysinibacillus alkalisoli]
MKDVLLEQKILNKEAIIGVVGLGYVGLTLSITANNCGFHTIGIDVDQDKIDQLNEGQSYLFDVTEEELSYALQQRLSVTSNFGALALANVIVLCLPTPIDEFQQPDLTYIEQAMLEVSAIVQPHTLLILESTSYPGTTVDYIVEPLVKKGFVVGENIWVAYSPERIDPGNQQFQTNNTPKIVGGMSLTCQKLATSFYENIIKAPIHKVSSPQTAEMAKLVENVFRNVNIALVNELAIICNSMDIDVWEVIDAASTKPYGYMPFYPGPGIGGHCIPVDPQYLIWKAKQHTTEIAFIEQAMQTNIKMSQYVFSRLLQVCNHNKIIPKEAHVLFVGVAYKKNSNDYRETPLFPLLALAEQYGMNYIVADPHITEYMYKGKVYETVTLTAELVQAASIVVIVTDHDAVDYQLLDIYSQVIFDTRRVQYPFVNKQYIVL